MALDRYIASQSAPKKAASADPADKVAKLADFNRRLKAMQEGR